jgi:hypothetical protein
VSDKKPKNRIIHVRITTELFTSIVKLSDEKNKIPSEIIRSGIKRLFQTSQF